MTPDPLPGDMPLTSAAPDAPDAPKVGLLSPAAVDAVAIASSVGTALMASWLFVQRSAYKNLSSLGAFDDMKPVRKERFHQIMDQFEKGLITKRDSMAQIDRLIDVNEAEALNRMSKVGIEGFGSRWRLLRHHQKLEIIAIAAVAGSVALGSILPLARDMLLTPLRKEPPDNGLSL